MTKLDAACLEDRRIHSQNRATVPDAFKEAVDTDHRLRREFLDGATESRCSVACDVDRAVDARGRTRTGDSGDDRTRDRTSPDASK